CLFSTDPPSTALYTLSLHDALPILPAAIARTLVLHPEGDPVNARGSHFGCLWLVLLDRFSHSSAQAGHQLPRFVLLVLVTLAQHLVEDVAGAFVVAHVDVGARQVELGGGFV